MKLKTWTIMIIALLSAANVFAQEPQFNTLELVNTFRLSRTEYEYTYRVVIDNPGPEMIQLLGKASGGGEGTTILDGEVAFGSVTAGGQAKSSDTITLKHNRVYPFNPAAISWSFSGTFQNGLLLPPDPGEEGKVTLTGIDSDNDGVRDDIQRFIVLNYGNNVPLVNALHGQALAQQELMVNGQADKEAALRAFERYTLAAGCSSLLEDRNDALVTNRKLRAQLLNTEERYEAYMRADQNLSGETFSVGSQTEIEQSCQ
ncbi:hypothetical protein [Trichloromonas acetexigens]|uniref:Uncharacterized protein n=1 Tax=Trichloromonas acetexigens TaxID=38815 RepID=A0A550JH81_9BACT|nr:hypothetical protein [Desulfuromonas acetexigens]TRO82575.1 hypothetical protein FL622_05125 [Desulfuromonas acetexigens]